MEEKNMEGKDSIAALIRSMFRLQDQETVRILAEHAEIRHYQAGQELYAVGTLHQAAVFLLEGIAQCEFRDADNRRHVLCFAVSTGYPLVTPSTTHRTISATVATTALKTLEIPITVLAPLLEKSIELLWTYNQLMNWAVTAYSELSMMLRLSAAQRYAWMCRNLPGVNEHASGRDIASFLGISPETLSRLRKQYATEPLPPVTGTMYDARLGRGMSYLMASARSGHHQFGEAGAVEDLAEE